ncbi:glycoprotein membrane precursor GPI-anchored [Striga asiatica]|uniref:Glycoprotein membrane GPI-anchored n=1 Tax=Striga asiatica TaxID=4170 RepID=A0A5A7P6H7_STRAF|nr:glycoprotein membrane precursor GPI-anchored [Striga asiatica]
MDSSAWPTLADLIGQEPRACICVLTVSTGNIAMCSTMPATEPPIMNCQKWIPSCAATAAEGSGWCSMWCCGTGISSGLWNFAEASVAIRDGKGSDKDLSEIGV